MMARSFHNPVRLLCLAASLVSPASAQFQPVPQNAGAIRSWGDDAMAPVLHAWQKAFRVYHPEITFSEQLYGTATGMAGIITGTADLALMGRPVTVNEVIGFEWVFRYKPLQFQVLNGGLARADARGKSQSLVVLVSAKNPVTNLTMKQLAAILTCPAECGSGGKPTWALAGVQGKWASHPVQAYLPNNQTGTGAFLQQAVPGAGDRWNWSIVHEFDDDPSAIAEALRLNPDGLAVTTLGSAGPGLKAITLDHIAPAPASVIAGTYPLSRGVYLDINRKPGSPAAPRLAEFVRFILSAEGQAIAAREGTFLPLNAAAEAEQRKKLDP